MPICSYCRYTKFWKLSDGRYRCVRCRRDQRFRTGTFWSKSRILPYWKGRLLEYFCLGVPAYRLRFRVPLHLHTIERFYRLVRLAIYQDSLRQLSRLAGEIEMDETMFGGRRPGKRGWGAEGKAIVFGMYQRNGKVLTFPIASRSRRILLPLIIQHTKPGSLYYTDDWHAYASLAIRGNHVVVEKEKGQPRGRNHLNGIEGFWSYAKHFLYPYRGVPKQYFHLYLKEIEWRCNHRDQDLVALARGLMDQPFQGV